jgi:hypothetical protein
VLSQHLAGGTNDNYEKSRSEFSVERFDASPPTVIALPLDPAVSVVLLLSHKFVQIAMSYLCYYLKEINMYCRPSPVGVRAIGIGGGFETQTHGFVVNKLALKRIVFEFFCFPCHMLHTHPS